MPLSWIYGKIIEARNARFDRGGQSVVDLGARTISVGNITIGGTGKTPIVILVSRLLAERGEKVCILTRGYGRKHPKRRVVVSDGERLLADVENAGDEPYEMAKRLLGKAAVIADADRVASAEWARRELGTTAFVLDDGFQHRRAKRDLDIVCIDAIDPFGGGKLLPFGRLREPVENLKRADAIVITRADLAENVADLRFQLAKFSPKHPVFLATSKMSSLTLLGKFAADETVVAAGRSFDMNGVVHKSGFAFCGLGNPEAFFGQLRRDNYNLAGEHAFGDHHNYGRKDIDLLNAKAKAAGAGFLLTTPKDAVKLNGLTPELPCFVVSSDVVIDRMEKFAALL